MSRQETAVPVVIPTQVVEEETENEMDVEEEVEGSEVDPELSLINEKEVEDMVGVQDTEVIEKEVPQAETLGAKSPRMWPDVDTERAMRHYKEVAEVQQTYQDDVDLFDTTMVSEYSDEIFKYMTELEVSSLESLSSVHSFDRVLNRRT
jgi:DNA-binding sugar fermentation-stimulating protein